NNDVIPKMNATLKIEDVIMLIGFSSITFLSAPTFAFIKNPIKKLITSSSLLIYLKYIPE
ncbi:TPA: hypothetical protein ACMEVZ_005594, partial [Klebsiella pneumoniae]